MSILGMLFESRLSVKIPEGKLKSIKSGEINFL
jgi:hypothetical protein